MANGQGAVVVPIKRKTTGSKKKTASKKKAVTKKKATRKKAVKKKTERKPRKSRAEKFLADKSLQTAFKKKYPVCTGKFRKAPEPRPTPSHSVQAQVKLSDGKLKWVYTQDVFQVAKKNKKK